MVKPSRTLIGITTVSILLLTSGCLGLTGETTTEQQPETQSDTIPAEEFNTDKVHGAISGESLDGYDVKVNIVAENKSAYRCSVNSFNKRIPNTTKVDAISITNATCDGVLVKAVHYK